MRVETAKSAKGSKKSKPRRRVWIALALGAVFLLGALALPLGMNPEFAKAAFNKVGETWPGLKEMSGLGAFSGKKQDLKAYARDMSAITDRVTDLPKSFLRDSKLPTLIVDIKFKHLRRLHDKRAAALKRGYLTTGPNDLVPAKIRLGGKSHRVKIRLKGDLPDHYNTDKWSLRVQVKGSDQILGMRRFSLQAPKTRQYHGQSLYLDFMRRFGVLAPRYHFVDMWVNGTNIGLMALEEHFSKELVESQGRRDSVILAFDESLAWERWAKWEGGHEFHSFFNDYTNARIKAFRFGRITKSKRLLADYRMAVGLLRGVVDGRLRPSEAFDVERLGRYIAVAQLWGSRHDTDWNNLRFYFNPITARLEPVAFDGTFEYWEKNDRLIEAPQVLMLRLMADEAVFESYYRALMSISKQVLDGALLGELSGQEKATWRELIREFPLLERFPLAEIKRRARMFRTMRKADLALSVDNPEAQANARARAARPLLPPFSQLIHAYRITDGNTDILELRNAMPEAVEIRSIRWVVSGEKEPPAFKTNAPLAYPLRLPAKTLDAAAEPRLIPFIRPVSKTPLDLVIETRRAGGTESVWSEAVASAPVLSARPIPDAGVSETLSRHRFLQWEAASRRLLVQRGDWLVTGDIIVPAGVRLEVPGGTRLRFEPGSALIAHGPLSLKGDKQAPIILEGASGRWQGVAILQAKDLSRWSHVEVRGTSGVARGDWSLTGGVTFYESPVEMTSVTLTGHSGEDALNIVSTRFELIDVNIEQTASDAFDSDFSSGRIVGGVYRNIGGDSGGDGIDVSGSTVSIDGVHFDGVSDKALSIGEGSRVEARNVRIRDASTGAASKDGSSLTLTESTIEGARVAGLMAYQKKPVYGGGQLDARGVTITGDAPAALAQEGSRITVDNTQVVARKLDVDRLYETVMRKAGTQ